MILTNEKIKEAIRKFKLNHSYGHQSYKTFKRINIIPPISEKNEETQVNLSSYNQTFFSRNSTKEKEKKKVNCTFDNRQSEEPSKKHLIMLPLCMPYRYINHSLVGLQKDISKDKSTENKLRLHQKIKIKKFKNTYDLVKFEYYQKNMSTLKEKLNYDKIFATFLQLKKRIDNTPAGNYNNIIKQFLFENRIFDMSIFSIRNFDNFITFLKGDFKNKIDRRKTIRENVLDILQGNNVY